MTDWLPHSWQNLPIRQQPSYPDVTALEGALTKIKSYPPLVFAGEVEKLKRRLSAAAQGEAFVLQAGDCAERFDQCTPDIIRKKIGLMMQMSLVLGTSAQKPIVSIGRIAGQYAKPRSHEFEERGDLSLPIYRGDMINGMAPTLAARQPDPARLVEAYHKSSMTLNFIRALFDGEFPSLEQSKAWGLDEKSFPSKNWERWQQTLVEMNKSWDMVKRQTNSRSFQVVWDGEFYVSHESLLLSYESAMTRFSEDYKTYYNTGAHFLWLGNRTRTIGEAHVEYLRGLQNPIGIKIDERADPSTIVELLKLLNPSNAWGKIMLIPRYGLRSVGQFLPAMIAAIDKHKQRVLWSVDPMHGNVFLTSSGRKTRDFDVIVEELDETLRIHARMGTYLGAIHLEMTGEDVTECVGGSLGLKDLDLQRRYETYCDPRLNAAQGLEISQILGDKLAGRETFAPNVIPMKPSFSVPLR